MTTNTWQYTTHDLYEAKGKRCNDDLYVTSFAALCVASVLLFSFCLIKSTGGKFAKREFTLFTMQDSNESNIFKAQ